MHSEALNMKFAFCVVDGKTFAQTVDGVRYYPEEIAAISAQTGVVEPIVHSVKKVFDGTIVVTTNDPHRLW